MDDQESTLTYMQRMEENDMTNKILLPLFQKLGYLDITFHGGVYEAGKDLIAFKQDSFGRIDIFVGQAKKFKTTKSFETRNQWHEIVYQLRQARTRDIPCKDGQLRKPKDVAFITPFIIDCRLVEEQLAVVQLSDILILDGAALYKLIQQVWPSMLAEMASLDAKVVASMKGALKNIELFESLKIADEVPYENIYSDLNFFIGRADTKELICSSIQSHELPTNVSFETWQSIKENLIEVEKLVGFDVISSQISQIDSAYSAQNLAHLSDRNTQIAKTLRLLHIQELGLKGDFDHAIVDLKRLVKNANIIDTTDILNTMSDQLSGIRQISLNEKIDSPSKLDYLIASITTNHPRLKAVHENLYALRSILVKTNAINAQRQETALTYVPPPTINFKLDVASLLACVTSRLEWLRDAAHAINQKKMGASQLNEFLSKVETLLFLVNRLVHTKTFGRPVFSLARQPAFENRFCISAHSVFDSGRNIAVYGEAGAGKSTTLHIYANQRAKAAGISLNDAVVFLPMNRLMIAKSSSGYDETRDIERANYVRAMVRCILIYLKADSADHSCDEFFGWVKGKSRIVFIIDGLDEAVINNSWILKAINKLPEDLPNAQVIISSRDCIDEIKDIDFLGITLLPFTEAQLQRFIEGWRGGGSKLWESIKATSLIDVAKNPLLATIVCSLHEHGISILANEPDVYRKKIELLCGQYDRSKGVTRTKTPHDILERVARAIAFYMHTKHIREIEMTDITPILKRAFDGQIQKETYELAASELLSPCNILKRAPNSTTISFGHLRYQEFLASEEFIKNHENSPLDYLYDDWWRGALYLYAFSTNLETLMERMYLLNFKFAQAHGTLVEMIKAKPLTEQSRLRATLRRSNKMEMTDQLFQDLNETNAREYIYNSSEGSLREWDE